MKIRGLQITGELAEGFGTQIYIYHFKKMTADTDNGNWTITADEIISFIKARNNKSKTQELISRLKEIEKELPDSKAPVDLRLERSAIFSRLDGMAIEIIMGGRE